MIQKLLYRNFRFVYRLGHWLQHRLTPAGMIILACIIAAGVFGLDTRQTLAFQIFSLAAVLMLLALVSSFTFRGRFTCERKLPDIACVGEKLHYRVTVGNSKKNGQHDLVIVDELEDAFPGYQEFRQARDPNERQRNVFDRLIGYPKLVTLAQQKRGGNIKPATLDHLPSRDKQAVRFFLLPLRRGYLHFKRTQILRPDPLGLFRARKTCPLENTLLVLPRQYRLPPIKLPGRRMYQPGGVNMTQSVGDSEEFFSLREYRPGDPLRSIHWRSYARKGEPIVKEYQDEYFIRQGLVLDTFLENRAPQVLEEAVSIAASFVSLIPQQDALLDMLLVGDRAYHFTSGRGLARNEDMLEVLACVEACRHWSFSTLTDLIKQHAGNTSGFICVFLDWDKKRQTLINQLEQAGVPVHVIVIAMDDQQQAAINQTDHPRDFWCLPCGQVQSALDAMIPA